MQKTVVTILSTNYAGSHFLSLLLGSHSQACHLGEVRHLGRGTRPCLICQPPEKCPLVCNVNPGNIASLYETIFANFAAGGRPARTLIDTSKKIDWASRFLFDPTHQYRYIHLIRDPRALVRRYLLTHDSIKSALHLRRKAVLRGVRYRPNLLFAPQWKICAFKWLNQNMRIADFLERHRLDHQVVTYRDLAIDTPGEIKHLMEWMGFDYEPEQIRYWKFDHHGTQKSEYEWIKKKKKTGHIDLRWKDFLAAETSRDIVSDRDIVRLIDRLSLSLDETGLTRMAGRWRRESATP